ncbi:MAG: DUF389 domain-containing protein [Methylobacter sp.]
MNALWAIIASYSLLADSAAGVIGAMLVAMLLSPIAGVSLSLVDGDNALLRQSLLSLCGGVGIVVVCAWIIGQLHPDIPAGKELLGRTHPNYLDLMIALAGGAVGAYAVITPRIVNAVVGVAIATALVPPLCSGLSLQRVGNGIMLSVLTCWLLPILLPSSFLLQLCCGWLDFVRLLIGLIEMKKSFD